jgi:histidinol phosphatase-like enzyme (inositol monophosphatase family)
MSPELEAAIAAAQAAGRLQSERFGHRNQVELKADDTPVTAVDRDSEALIRQALAQALPQAGFLGEESASGMDAAAPSAGVRWIVDPLDGTKKFVRGLPFFGPCIALERDGDLVLGVMHLPLMAETIWAERGSGAYLNGEQVHVSVEARLDRAYVAYSSEAEFLRRGWSRALVAMMSGSYHQPGFLDLYSYVSLASGRVDAVVNIGEAPWDIAAARIILEEAGGRLTDFTGVPTVYGGTTLATNGHLHGALFEILRSQPPAPTAST